MRCRALLEGAAFKAATVHPDAVRVELAVQEGSTLEGLAAGAGGAGARLETSFAAGSPDKVPFCTLPLQSSSPGMLRPATPAPCLSCSSWLSQHAVVA